MTITYSLDVANTRFCGFAKLLGKWKGSIYKILWKEFFVFIIGYTLISVTYRCFLDSSQRRAFESVVIYFEAFVDLIPLSFVLGFYVSLVIGRWWEQFDAIPWPDRMCYLITAYVHGADERSRVIRRTLGRYLILMQALTFQSVSTAVKRRFPTTEHFVIAGFMTQEEHTVFSSLEAPYGKWWLPAQWFSALAMRARKEGRIKDTILLNGLMKEFLSYRSACGTMFNYDWISVPLVYTQVVTLATYTYSLALMVGRQYLDPEQGHANHKVDLYVPIFTLLQFFFYMGWLKVAEQIVNPYGEDDDDFELNWCLNRSCQVVYMLVDHFHTKHPKLRRDAFWDILLPDLPQTKSTAKNIINPQLGSAFNLEVNPADAEFLPPDTLLEEDNEANVYNSDSVKGVRYRPSFLMSLFGQSMRKRSSMLKVESFREASSDNKFSPANSRKSSLAKTVASPSHSRASSLSFNPNSISRHRHKSYELQHDVGNGAIPEGELANKTDQAEEDPKLDGGHMPPIPEEPSCRRPSKSSEVQSLVAEANKVLEELNKVVSSGVHRTGCENKGYESCCSLDSDDEEEDEPKELYPDTVTVDLPKAEGEDSQRNVSG